MRLTQSSFTIHEDENDTYTGRLIIGQILARFALELSSTDDLPCENELISLEKAEIKSCRGNLVRSIAMKLLSGMKTSNATPRARMSRPSFLFCSQDISTWPDDMYFPFLIRFYDYLNSKLYRNCGCSKIQDMLKCYSDEICGGPGFVWLTPEHLPNMGFEVIIAQVRKNEIYAKKLRRSFLQHEEYKRSGRLRNVSYYETEEHGPLPDYEIFPDSYLVQKVLSEGEQITSLFKTYRNEAAHFFDFCAATGQAMALSRDFVNYWRTNFPKMVLAAWLVCVHSKLYKNSSFGEFFTCPNDDFYNLFENQHCDGTYMASPK